MIRRMVVLLVIGATALLGGSVAGQTKPELPEVENTQISRTELARKSEAAIRRGVRFLISRQNPDGSWGNGSSTDAEAGNTALVALALLSCGESHQSPPLDRAIKFLKKSQPQKALHATYSVALRACVYAQLPEVLRKTELPADLRWLQENLIKTGKRRGMYDYGEGESLGGDYSNSQYGVLGVWYAALAGLEVPRNYWKLVEDAWRAGQLDSGGWGYVPGERGGEYASMTAAGAATLFITNDYLHARDAEDLSRITVNAPIEQAIEWLGRNFAVEHNPGRDTRLGEQVRADKALLDILGELGRNSGTYVHYMLFGYERVGEASGLTRFGPHRWFNEGADYLIRTQAYDGSWTGTIGSEADTAYSLLFLSRGRAPVVIQKLQFDGRWNNRARDASAFTHFMRRASERHVNWQVVSLDAPADELRESSILYAVSDRAIKLSDTQKHRLRAYIHQGGLLVCVNEGKTNDFAQSIETLVRELFPQYAFRDLPRDHPVYTANFPVSVPTEPIRGLSNGVREWIVLYPAGDMSWKWHSNAGGFTPRMSPFASLANLHLYVTDRANPRFKGEDSWIERNPGVQTTRVARLARIPYDGNWDPEPAGWVRLANLMANLDQVDLKVQPLPMPQNGATHPLAHLTAVQSLQLAPSLKDALRGYLNSGGLLLLDAAGGTAEASGSFDPLLRELFPTVKIEPLPLDHAIYRGSKSGGEDIEQVKYRRSRDLQPVHIPRLRGATVDGRLIAIVSYEDLSGALVGYSTAGLNGYSPDSAADLVRNIILWRAVSR